MKRNLYQKYESKIDIILYLLKDILELIEVNSGVITHDGNGGDLLQGHVVTSLHSLAALGHVSDGLVGRAGDLEFLEVVSILKEQVIKRNFLISNHTYFSLRI